MCQQVDEEFLGGVGYTDFFLACVFSLKAEELIKRSPRGKRVHLLLEKITNIEAVTVTDIAMLLISKACSCIASGDKHKLPSTAQACVWSTFHQLRGSSEVKGAWDKFVSTRLELLELSQEEPDLALQLLFDRLLKKLLHNKANARKQTCTTSSATTINPLTAMEGNAIRYMSGCVAVNLLKKYRRPTKQPLVKEKRELFVHVLDGMRAVDQPGEPESVLEYTKLWSELIDRGGVYHISDRVSVLD